MIPMLELLFVICNILYKFLDTQLKRNNFLLMLNTLATEGIFFMIVIQAP